MIFNTDEFTFKNRVFTAEASDFSDGRFMAMFNQVFDDACDQGFELTSSRTGKKVKMTFEKAHRSEEGDITHWSFIPYRNTSFDKLVVFND